MLPLSTYAISNAPIVCSSGPGVDHVPGPADQELVRQRHPLEPLRSHGRGTDRLHDLMRG